MHGTRFCQALDAGEWATRGAGATLSLAIALGLLRFLARLRFRTVYGVAEVLAGVIVATTSFDGVALVTNATDGSLVLTFVTAAVFPIVRGLDNIHRGAAKEPLDPIGGKLLAWLSRPLAA
jgi:hypothetical protein